MKIKAFIIDDHNREVSPMLILHNIQQLDELMRISFQSGYNIKAKYVDDSLATIKNRG